MILGLAATATVTSTALTGAIAATASSPGTCQESSVLIGRLVGLMAKITPELHASTLIQRATEDFLDFVKAPIGAASFL
jgi:hypothetical protein